MTFVADLLGGRRVAFVGGGGVANLGRLEELGAWVCSLDGEVLLDDDDRAVAWAGERAPLDALVCDARLPFGAGGAVGLRSAMDLAWRGARAVATGAMIDSGRPARLIFVSPAPDAGPLAGSLRAALENLARTLSVEWARFRITAVSIAPATATADEELAELAAFLISDAGGYFSGCQIELGAVAVQ